MDRKFLECDFPPPDVDGEFEELNNPINRNNKMHTLTIAKVKYTAGKIIATKFGDRINAVLTTNSGEDVTVWGNPGSDIAQLKKGDLVQLLDTDGSGHWKVVSLPDSNLPYAGNNSPTKSSPEPIGMDDTKKREVASYVQEMAKLYGFCLNQASAIAPESLPPESIKDIASTLFITVQRKFNL